MSKRPCAAFSAAPFLDRGSFIRNNQSATNNTLPRGRRHRLFTSRFPARFETILCQNAQHPNPPPADPHKSDTPPMPIPIPTHPADFGPRSTSPLSSTKRARPIDAQNLAVKHGVSGGRGVVATRRIEPGQVAARVPEEATLSVCFADSLTDSANDDCPFNSGEWVTTSYWRVADWDSKLVCLLLYHILELGEDSPWYDYVNSLPQPDQLWTASDLDSRASVDLQYIPMMDAVEVYRFRLNSEFKRFQEALPPHLRHAVTHKDFAWAMKIVHSRAFSIPPGGFAASATRMGLRGAMQRGKGTEWPRKFAMVPFLDMMNHGCGDEYLASFKYDEEKNVFQLIAGKNGYTSGKQVLVSYGELTNDDLMLLYGFVQAGNPSDVYEIEDITDWTADHRINRDWNLFQRKLELLDDAGLTYEGRKFLIARDHVDEHLLATLRVLLATPEEFTKHILPKDGNVNRKRIKKPLDRWYAPISTENELSVWATVELHCDRMLAEFPTSLDEDEELIILLAAGSKESDVAVSAPLLFRVEKKRILRDVVQVAAMRQLCIATQVDDKGMEAMLEAIKGAMPPPPENWKQNLTSSSPPPQP